ncbi:MAG: deoxyuridine 5'-triphosphate nucleotidohydrolase [Ignisphaera sp.]|nr:deoxyuridine 5'-triphosphate nucleotidohydrolase [Ignisphaera sp.]MCX8167772.1 deoxyuridine 5'-triphosphate nucleotidohydrolase [Ignisphaera sp.]MDW8085241.1 deoxyuridine 5'-triphosphate nucleotidohydrolase [Ignisphaera sp.]
MILSPETLLELFNLRIDDIDCAGLKLHLDKIFIFRDGGRVFRESKRLPEVEEVKPNEQNIYRLSPGAYRVRYRELVKVPDNAVALAIPRSTLLRAGATIYTAVWDPGYSGRGEGLMVIFNQNGIEIEASAQIAQLVFIYMDRKTSFTYRGSYQYENIV